MTSDLEQRKAGALQALNACLDASEVLQDYCDKNPEFTFNSVLEFHEDHAAKTRLIIHHTDTLRTLLQPASGSDKEWIKQEIQLSDERLSHIPKSQREAVTAFINQESASGDKQSGEVFEQAVEQLIAIALRIGVHARTPAETELFNKAQIAKEALSGLKQGCGE